MALGCLHALVYYYREEAVSGTFLAGEGILGSPDVARAKLAGDVPLLYGEYLGEFNVLLQLHGPVKELEALQLRDQDVRELLYPLLVIGPHHPPIVLVIR